MTALTQLKHYLQQSISESDWGVTYHEESVTSDDVAEAIIFLIQSNPSLVARALGETGAGYDMLLGLASSGGVTDEDFDDARSVFKKARGKFRLRSAS